MSRLLFSLVMPTHNVARRWLEAAIESVRRQTWPDWQLCIADDGSSRPDTLAGLDELRDERIRIIRLNPAQGIAAASNAALAQATGEFVGFLDHDDELTPDALQAVAQALAESGADLLYSDEAYIKPNGRRYSAHFKPDYAPDLLLSMNYIGHLAVYRRSLLHNIGGLRPGYEGAQDHDLLLRFVEQTSRVIHLPRVLYRWRRIPGSTARRFAHKDYAWEAGRRAVAAALERRGIAGVATLGAYPGVYRVRRVLSQRPQVSMIIPFRDLPETLGRCLDSILQRTAYPHFEIIGVSNQSREPATLALMAAYARRESRLRFLQYDQPFNFAAINNFAAKHASGDHLLLLNNDTEALDPDWLEALLEHSQRPEIGAVGAKLYYPNNTIQHAGIIIGIGGSAGHSHKCLDRRDPGYFNRLAAIQNVSAVTGACLMVKRALYEALDGLDEQNLPIAFNDVDFCLRLREQGYLNVFTPFSQLYHHESRSRGRENTPDQRARFQQEARYLRQRHAAVFAAGDPYYNPNLPLDRETFGLRFRQLRPLAFAMREAWRRNHSLAAVLDEVRRESAYWRKRG